jgi:hypothetical protein
LGDGEKKEKERKKSKFDRGRKKTHGGGAMGLSN